MGEKRNILPAPLSKERRQLTLTLLLCLTIAAIYYLALLLFPYQLRIWILGGMTAVGFGLMFLPIKKDMWFSIGHLTVSLSIIMTFCQVMQVLVSSNAFALHR